MRAWQRAVVQQIAPVVQKYPARKMSSSLKKNSDMLFKGEQIQVFLERNI